MERVSYGSFSTGELLKHNLAISFSLKTPLNVSEDKKTSNHKFVFSIQLSSCYTGSRNFMCNRKTYLDKCEIKVGGGGEGGKLLPSWQYYRRKMFQSMGFHCPWVINKDCLEFLVTNFMLSFTKRCYLFFPLLAVFESLSLCECTASNYSLLGSVKRNSITKFKSITSTYISLSANVRELSSLKSVTGLVDGRGENIYKHSQKCYHLHCDIHANYSGWTGHWISFKFFI